MTIIYYVEDVVDLELQAINDDDDSQRHVHKQTLDLILSDSAVLILCVEYKSSVFCIGNVQLFSGVAKFFNRFCESWTIKKSDELRIEAFEMKGLRQIQMGVVDSKKNQ